MQTVLASFLTLLFSAMVFAYIAFGPQKNDTEIKPYVFYGVFTTTHIHPSCSDLLESKPLRLTSGFSNKETLDIAYTNFKKLAYLEGYNAIVGFEESLSLDNEIVVHKGSAIKLTQECKIAQIQSMSE